MPTWLWILIVVVVVVVLVLLLLWFTKGREVRRERKRAEADELRLEAHQRLGEAGRREAIARDEAARASESQEEAERLQREAEIRQARAREEAERASRERAEAGDTARHAEEIDPDAPDPGEDFDPGDPLRRARTETRPGGIDPREGEDPYVVRPGADDVPDAESGRPTRADDGDPPGARRA